MSFSNEILLSVCIPTYKREKFIGTALASIPEKYRDLVEICISENPSPGDNTQSVVESYRSRFSHFKYELRDRNYGFDDNLQHVVQMASGRYCWTIGSDDWPTPDALDLIFHVLREDAPGILIANQIACSVDKKRQYKNSWLPPEMDRYNFSFGDRHRFHEYCRLAQSICALGAFISSNIFDRQLWLAAELNKGIAPDYIHLNTLNAMILSPVNKERKFVYLCDVICVATIENDAIFTGEWSVKQRLFVDLRAMTEIADAYIADPELRKQFINILHRQHPFWDLYRTAVIPDCGADEMQLLYRIFPSWQIWICRYLGYRRGYAMHRILKKVMGLWRYCTGRG